MAHPRRLRYARIRQKVLERDGYRCQYCRTTDGVMTVDHIVPRSLGGPYSSENLVTSCLVCNKVLGSRLFLTYEDKRRYITPERRAHMKRLLRGKK